MQHRCCSNVPVLHTFSLFDISNNNSTDLWMLQADTTLFDASTYHYDMMICRTFAIMSLRCGCHWVSLLFIVCSVFQSASHEWTNSIDDKSAKLMPRHVLSFRLHFSMNFVLECNILHAGLVDMMRFGVIWKKWNNQNSCYIRFFAGHSNSLHNERIELTEQHTEELFTNQSICTDTWFGLFLFLFTIS